jgi:hypothetical protein
VAHRPDGPFVILVADRLSGCGWVAGEGSDLRLIVYTATPGSRDADTLALLGAVGLQSFA